MTRVKLTCECGTQVSADAPIVLTSIRCLQCETTLIRCPHVNEFEEQEGIQADIGDMGTIKNSEWEWLIKDPEYKTVKN